jgi:hypothetical protein
MGTFCSMDETREKMRNSTWITQRRVHLEELDVNGKIILKWVLNSVERVDWIYLAQGSFW